MSQNRSLRELGSLSVIIPAYNEAARLPQTLLDVRAYLTSAGIPFEICVIDDGSSDDTGNVVQELGSKIPELTYERLARNRGKGFAVRYGLARAKGSYRLFMDADHSTRINEIEKIIPLLTRGDIFVSSRYVKGSHVVIPQSKARIMVSRIANRFIRVLVPGVRDTQNGFKVFSASAAQKVVPYLRLNRWAFDVEMLYVARRLKLRIVEFPIEWRNARGSKLNVRRDLVNTAGEFAMLLSNTIRGRYPRG
jgi:dolichyl-phosphate beta-glucosyltransferase